MRESSSSGLWKCGNRVSDFQGAVGRGGKPLVALPCLLALSRGFPRFPQPRHFHSPTYLPFSVLATAAAAAKDGPPSECAAAEPLVAAAPRAPSVAACRSPPRPPRGPRTTPATRRPVPARASLARPLPDFDSASLATARNGSRNAPPGRLRPHARPPNRTPTLSPDAWAGADESPLPPLAHRQTWRCVLSDTSMSAIPLKQAALQNL